MSTNPKDSIAPSIDPSTPPTKKDPEDVDKQEKLTPITLEISKLSSTGSSKKRKDSASSSNKASTIASVEEGKNKISGKLKFKYRRKLQYLNHFFMYSLHSSCSKATSVVHGLSFVARNGKSAKTSILLEAGRVVDEAAGTKSNPIELFGKPTTYCALCGCKGKFCHENRYGRQCLKAVYSFLHNSTKSQCFSEDWTGCCKDSIVGVYKRAYNERRKADLQFRFGFENPNWMSVPECMKRKSLKQAITIMYDPILVLELKKENEEGYQKFCLAKSHYEA